MKWLKFPWRCRERSWTVSGPDLRNACVKTEAILRALFSKHKFSNWHKTKWLFIRFSFMTNKQIKNSCVDFFNVLKFSRFIAQPCICELWTETTGVLLKVDWRKRVQASLAFCMTTISAGLTKYTTFPFQSRDCIYYVSRRILAPPPHWLQKHTNSMDTTLPSCVISLRIANINWVWSWTLWN